MFNNPWLLYEIRRRLLPLIFLIVLSFLFLAEASGFTILLIFIGFMYLWVGVDIQKKAIVRKKISGDIKEEPYFITNAYHPDHGHGHIALTSLNLSFVTKGNTFHFDLKKVFNYGYGNRPTGSHGMVLVGNFGSTIQHKIPSFWIEGNNDDNSQYKLEWSVQRKKKLYKALVKNMEKGALAEVLKAEKEQIQKEQNELAQVNSILESNFNEIVSSANLQKENDRLGKGFTDNLEGLIATNWDGYIVKNYPEAASLNEMEKQSFLNDVLRPAALIGGSIAKTELSAKHEDINSIAPFTINKDDFSQIFSSTVFPKYGINEQVTHKIYGLFREHFSDNNDILSKDSVLKMSKGYVEMGYKTVMTNFKMYEEKGADIGKVFKY